MIDEPYSQIPYIDESFRYAYSLVYKKNKQIEDCYFLVGAVIVSDAREDHAIIEFIDDEPDVTDFMISNFVEKIELLCEDSLASISMRATINDDIFLTKPLLTQGKSADAIAEKLNKIAINRDYIIKDERVKEFMLI